LFVTGTFSSPTESVPGVLQGAEAAADSINSRGGINGHQIQLISCNDEQDPNQAADCAREAVSDHVTAVIGLFILAPSVFPILEAANIPVIDGDPISDPTPTAPNSFPLNAGSDATFRGTGEKVVESGAKNVVLIETAVPPIESVGAAGAQGVQAAGGKIVKTVTYTAGTPDFGPVVQEALSAPGVNGIILQCLQSDLGPITIALRAAGFNGPIGYILSATSPGFAAQVSAGGANTSNLIFVNNWYQPPAPQASQFLSDLKKYEPSALAQIELTTQAPWAAVYAIQEALTGKTGTDAAALTAALSSQTALNIGPYSPPINMSKPGPIAGSPRFFNPMVIQYALVKGQFQAVGTFFNPYAAS
jgi:ABC-type branched-subunit amino acid transport system substrate-binding protein